MRRLCRLMRLIRRAVILISAVFGVGCTPTEDISSARGVLRTLTDEIRPTQRIVLVFIDVSASMPLYPIRRDLARLAAELAAADRVIVAAISDRTHEFTPVLDTVLPGGRLSRIAARIGVTTSHSRVEHEATVEKRRELLGAAWLAAQERHGATRTSWLLDAVCHSADLAATYPRHEVVALLLTDGLVEEPLADFSRGVPTIAHAQRTAKTLSARGGCDLDQERLAVRLTGVTHRYATVALRAWWRAFLQAMGARIAQDDVASQRARPLLAKRTER